MSSKSYRGSSFSSQLRSKCASRFWRLFPLPLPSFTAVIGGFPIVTLLDLRIPEFAEITEYWIKKHKEIYKTQEWKVSKDIGDIPALLIPQRTGNEWNYLMAHKKHQEISASHPKKILFKPKLNSRWVDRAGLLLGTSVIGPTSGTSTTADCAKITLFVFRYCCNWSLIEQAPLSPWFAVDVVAAGSKSGMSCDGEVRGNKRARRIWAKIKIKWIKHDNEHA